jgi:hypothetical protein
MRNKVARKQTKHIELEQEIKNKDYLDESFFLILLKNSGVIPK